MLSFIFTFNSSARLGSTSEQIQKLTTSHQLRQNHFGPNCCQPPPPPPSVPYNLSSIQGILLKWHQIMSFLYEKTKDQVLTLAPEGLYDVVPCGPLTSSPLTTPTTLQPHWPLLLSLLPSCFTGFALALAFAWTTLPPDCHVAHSAISPGLSQTHAQGGSGPTPPSSTHTHSLLPFPAFCCSTVPVAVWHLLYIQDVLFLDLRVHLFPREDKPSDTSMATCFVPNVLQPLEQWSGT